MKKQPTISRHMRIVFGLSLILNSVVLLGGLWTSTTRWLAGHGNPGAIGAPVCVGCLFLAASLTGIWLWTAGYYLTAVWVSLTLWLTMLVVGGTFLLLNLGQRWN